MPGAKVMGSGDGCKLTGDEQGVVDHRDYVLVFLFALIELDGADIKGHIGVKQDELGEVVALVGDGEEVDFIAGGGTAYIAGDSTVAVVLEEDLIRGLGGLLGNLNQGSGTGR